MPVAGVLGFREVNPGSGTTRNERAHRSLCRSPSQVHTPASCPVTGKLVAACPGYVGRPHRAIVLQRPRRSGQSANATIPRGKEKDKRGACALKVAKFFNP